MALPAGLLPVLAFALTVGVAATVTAVTHLLARSEARLSFASALRTAFSAVGAAYLVGVVVVWYVAGGVARWEVAAALVAAGPVSFAVLAAVPIAAGRRLVERARDVDPDTALRPVTAGWVVSSLAVFGIFVAPGGLARGHLLSLGGPRVCLVGFCGVAVSLLGAVLLELAVALSGPGLVALALSAASRTRDRTAGS